MSSWAYDSVEFLSHPDASDWLFSADLKCGDGNTDMDFLTVSSDKVTLETRRDGRTSTNFQEEEMAPMDEKGWIQFRLNLKHPYALTDGHGRPWFPSNRSTDCMVEKVDIKGPLLMRRCEEDFPTWNISENEEATIPLLPVIEGGTHKGHFILLSKNKFTPKLSAGGEPFYIGLEEGQMSVSTTTPKVQLQAYTQHLVLLLLVEASTTTLKVTTYTQHFCSK